MNRIGIAAIVAVRRMAEGLELLPSWESLICTDQILDGGSRASSQSAGTPIHRAIRRVTEEG